MTPSYDYACENCGREWEAFHHLNDYKNEKCTCGAPAKILIKNTQAVHIFNPFWCEDLGPEPVFIESKRQLKREAARRNLIAAGL